ncbi:retrotransposon protein, putative, ty1-copia subclass [Tanacetum coccineum]
MDNFKRGYIPMQERLDLNKTQGASTHREVKRMQNVPYASAVGSIMYAVRCTRPDVAFTQNITSCYQQNPGEPYRTAVKTILKYLRNTKDMFLVYVEILKLNLELIAIAMLDFRLIEMIQNLRHDTFSFSMEAQWTGKAPSKVPTHCILDAETVAKSFPQSCVSLSVICPRQLPKLKAIYNAEQSEPPPTSVSPGFVKDFHISLTMLTD